MSVDVGHALPVDHWAVLQTRFGGNVLRGLRQLPVSQRAQQRLAQTLCLKECIAKD